ncbi:hypothetical protein Hanom_Chr03g00247011 [Helianthus anomalus]
MFNCFAGELREIDHHVRPPFASYSGLSAFLVLSFSLSHTYTHLHTPKHNTPFLSLTLGEYIHTYEYNNIQCV